MKIRISVKSPDMLYNAMDDIPDEGDGIHSKEDILGMFEKYVKFGEYVNIELETETGECRVVPVKEI